METLKTATSQSQRVARFRGLELPSVQDAHADSVMPKPDRRLNLLVVDDHEVVRQGLTAFLNGHDGFEVVAEAGTCGEAISQARKFCPDLVLMDLRLPDATGIEACRLLHDEFPGLPVVFLTSSPDEVDVLAAVIAGARGYVLKQSRSAELVRTLEAVWRGESLFDPSVTGAVLDRIRRIASDGESGGGNGLTVREREILPLIAEGKSNKEIAAATFLSDKTVKNYVSSILAKLGLTRRAQVPAFVADHGPQRPGR
jgi:two-component system, NarL family, response regulator DevR